MDGWNTFSFPFGAFRPIFRCVNAVSFREGRFFVSPSKSQFLRLLCTTSGPTGHLTLGDPCLSTLAPLCHHYEMSGCCEMLWFYSYHANSCQKNYRICMFHFWGDQVWWSDLLQAKGLRFKRLLKKNRCRISVTWPLQIMTPMNFLAPFLDPWEWYTYPIIYQLLPFVTFWFPKWRSRFQPCKGHGYGSKWGHFEEAGNSSTG